MLSTQDVFSLMSRCWSDVSRPTFMVLAHTLDTLRSSNTTSDNGGVVTKDNAASSATSPNTPQVATRDLVEAYNLHVEQLSKRRDNSTSTVLFLKRDAAAASASPNTSDVVDFDGGGDGVHPRQSSHSRSAPRRERSRKASRSLPPPPPPSAPPLTARREDVASKRTSASAANSNTSSSKNRVLREVTPAPPLAHGGNKGQQSTTPSKGSQSTPYEREYFRSMWTPRGRKGRHHENSPDY
jgi:hypothetical protein